MRMYNSIIAVVVVVYYYNVFIYILKKYKTKEQEEPYYNVELVWQQNHSLVQIHNVCMYVDRNYGRC